MGLNKGAMLVLERATDVPTHRLVAFRVRMGILCIAAYGASNLLVSKDDTWDYKIPGRYE